jgi:hypothetical protein
MNIFFEKTDALFYPDRRKPFCAWPRDKWRGAAKHPARIRPALPARRLCWPDRASNASGGSALPMPSSKSVTNWNRTVRHSLRMTTV